MKYTLQHIADLSYRWWDLQAIEYTPIREEIFPPPFLTTLYNLCLHSGRAKLGILESLFCGMTDLSHDSITSYLHTRKLIVLGEWRTRGGEEAKVTEFIPLGFCFLSTFCKGKTTASAFGAYAFFSEAWRTPQQHCLTLLGIAFLLKEFELSSLHGIRYADNRLTARWMARFGFEDVGTLQNYLPRHSTGELTAATISTLDRVRFEELFSAMLEKVEEQEG
jgi:hypothetical protein